MTTVNRYATPIESLEWIVPERFESSFRWEYEDGSESLLRLYEKDKKQQWNASDRIDWSLDLDPENPEELPDEYLPIFGSPVWERMTKKERVDLRRHRMIGVQPEELAGLDQVERRIADTDPAHLVAAHLRRHQGRAHARQLGLARSGPADRGIRLLKSVVQAAALLDRVHERLDRDLAGNSAAGMTAHAVGDHGQQ